jgi:hypothetical protein
MMGKMLERQAERMRMKPDQPFVRSADEITPVGWVERSVTQRGRVLGYAALHPTDKIGAYLILIP